ncbi:MAG: amino acid ABC transporter permease [Treponema sp.]|nr:amino acid ABC transporter permease [Treponema sp.]
MFLPCGSGTSYEALPVYRKRWFALTLLAGNLWVPLLFYYLPGAFHGFFLKSPGVFIVLGICWGLLLAVLCTGDLYALRNHGVCRIGRKWLFMFLSILVLAALTAAGMGIKTILARLAAGGGFLKTLSAWAVQLLEGSRITLWLTVLAVSAGLVLSFFLALGKMSKKRLLSKSCSAYIFFFRGTPLLMQLYFIYYGLPQITAVLTINNRFIAAFIAFSLNSAAYCAEIIRAAIQSIDRGQFEASRALGLSYAKTMSLVIVPQSIRRLIPPVGNEFIMMLKDASLVSIIALTDITKVTRSISSSTASAMVYIPAMILYLIITAVFTFVFHKLETRYSAYV